MAKTLPTKSSRWHQHRYAMRFLAVLSVATTVHVLSMKLPTSWNAQSRTRCCMSPGASQGPKTRRNVLAENELDEGAWKEGRRELPTDRRSVILATAALLGVSVWQQGVQSAHAYEKSYPQELGFENGDSSRDLTALREASIARKKATKKKSMDYISSSDLFRGPQDLLSSVVWGGALWLLTGSRSNPLVTPLANVIYTEKDEPWLKDRNEGLFAPVPTPLYALLGLMFFVLGILLDRVILLVAEGDASVTLQLAGVSLIGGAALELGRIASGEKGQTRKDFDRNAQLDEEFAQFAENRLKPGGNCHRSEVVKAFRRYYGKYRQADSDEYPLSDLEIERLLRAWNRTKGNTDMSSAGFFNGIQINDQADVFANR